MRIVHIGLWNYVMVVLQCNGQERVEMLWMICWENGTYYVEVTNENRVSMKVEIIMQKDFQTRKLMKLLQ